ncbi:hypothetical protein C8T65DRAFT_665420 [Cerioporus squamosus]|nr:hypothetical protein C8T65DRAFT_665420 [Cerioporus squamosus]
MRPPLTAVHRACPRAIGRVQPCRPSHSAILIALSTETPRTPAPLRTAGTQPPTPRRELFCENVGRRRCMFSVCRGGRARGQWPWRSGRDLSIALS